jgi:hypothetical protein
MIHRVLKIGRWVVDFLFATDRYDIAGIFGCLHDAKAPDWVIEEAYDLIARCDKDCGFTYSRQERSYSFANPDNHRAVVLIGPTSSGKEFLNTLAHEIHHLTVRIAESLGVDLSGEEPAYLAGDTMMAFADVVCKLGCRK